MRCPIHSHETAEVLLAYCDRRLAPEAVADLERHMEVCPACRAFCQGQRMVWNALDAWEMAPVSPDFDRRLYDRIEQDSQAAWWTRLHFRKVIPMAAAACLLVAAGALFDYSGQAPEETDVVQIEQVERTLDDMELLRQLPGAL